MESAHWHSRKRASLAMARAAVGSEARLIHYELAGRYSIKAAQSAIPELEVIDVRNVDKRLALSEILESSRNNQHGGHLGTTSEL